MCPWPRWPWRLRAAVLSSFETTVLLTVDETMDALRRVEQVGYRAPGG